MSVQCWCYTCGGAVVTRSTFRAHGRHAVPPTPVEEKKIAMESMPEFPSEGALGDDWSDTESSSSEDEDLEMFSAQAWQNLLQGESGEAFGRGGMTTDKVVHNI